MNLWDPVEACSQGLGFTRHTQTRGWPRRGGRSTATSRPGLSPSHGTKAPIALCLSLPVTQDCRKKFSCVWRIPCPTQDNALLPHSSWLLHWLGVTYWSLCPREDASSSWQPSLAMPTDPETLPRQAVPSNLPVRAAMRPLLQGQLSSGWLPRGSAYAGNCNAELRGASNSQWSLRSDLSASYIGLKEHGHGPEHTNLGWTPQ